MSQIECTAEFDVKVISNKGNEYTVTIARTVWCDFEIICVDGYNQTYEPTDSSLETETDNAIDEFFYPDNLNDGLEECEYLLEKKLAEDERIIGFTELKAVA